MSDLDHPMCEKHGTYCAHETGSKCPKCTTPPDLLKKKYAVVPGLVRSKYDNDEHYINASQLMALYNVDPSTCYIITDDAQWHGIPKEVKVLRPRQDGDYRT